METSNSGDSAARRSRDGALQPSDARLRRSLSEFDSHPAAEHLERLEADTDLVLTLQLQRFDVSTVEWQKFANALAQYGWSVFVGWLVTGVVRERLEIRGVRGSLKVPEKLRLDRDAATGLAADVVFTSIKTFRERVLVPNIWRADKGASLKTFFIGQCLFQFPDVYVRWEQQERPESLLHLDQMPDRPAPDRVEDTGLAAAQVDELMGKIEDPETRTMFELQANLDYTLSEIADSLNLSEAQVRTRMSRARRRLLRRPNE